jgi:hypothetical protein
MDKSAADKLSTPRSAFPALAGVTAAITMFGAAQGLSYPLFTILMQRQGLSPTLIGLSSAMMPLGLILSAPLVPAAVRIFGERTLAAARSGRWHSLLRQYAVG